MLAALAIMIPLAIALLPQSTTFAWQGWLLQGAVLVGVVCMFGTIYCMIQLQDFSTASFKLKDRVYIPAWTNTTWVALGALAICVALLRLFPAEEGRDRSSPGLPGLGTRFGVARDLPQLRTSRIEIEKAWGSPASASGDRLLYGTSSGGVIVFCLDHDARVIGIIETQGGNDAIRQNCDRN
jgi:hypothetical protein